jgi:CheY-like chemotaxis protein
MKTLNATFLAAAVLLGATASTSALAHGGHHHGGHHHGGHHRHHGVRLGVFIGAPVVFAPWYYHPPAYYHYPHTVVVPSSPVGLVGDGTRLQQVLWNLLSNAVKFTPRAGRVGIRVAMVDSQVQIQVTDTGQGIGADFLPYVFDRFTQADGEKRRAPTGLGLGLALVREMVQAHGGTVVAESPGEGHGSTFTVTLPTSAAASMLNASKVSTTQAKDVVESLPQIDILIVDDDGDVRGLLALLLESRGAVVRAVSSATEALDAISRHRPDVLLADLRMPEEDGYSLIRKLRAREREQQDGRLPAIAVTAYASPRDREQAIAAGYDGHVAKPVDPGELARAIVKVAKAENV